MKWLVITILLLLTAASALALGSFKVVGNNGRIDYYKDFTSADFCLAGSCGGGPGGNASFNQTLTDSLYTTPLYVSGAVGQNLTLALINTNIGNWSADKASYFPWTSIGGAVGQNLTYALVVTNIGNWSSDRPNYVNFTTLNGAVGANLTLALINTNIGNWSSDRPNYVNYTSLNGAIGQNLTYALINTNMGNWSADKGNYFLTSSISGAVGQNLTYALINTNMGNWSADKAGYSTLAATATNIGNLTQNQTQWTLCGAGNYSRWNGTGFTCQVDQQGAGGGLANGSDANFATLNVTTKLNVGSTNITCSQVNGCVVGAITSALQNGTNANLLTLNASTFNVGTTNMTCAQVSGCVVGAISAVPYQSTAAGLTNTTSLITSPNTMNISIDGNTTFFDVTNNRVGVLVLNGKPNQALEVNGSVNATGFIVSGDCSGTTPLWTFCSNKTAGAMFYKNATALRRI